jgi:hypothetical protein
MPTIVDPTIGCKYRWGDREDSILKMESRVILSAGDKIPLTISIHRAILRLYYEPLKRRDDRCSRAIKIAFEKLSKRTGEHRESSHLINSLAPESIALLSDFKALERLRKHFFTLESLAENIACSLYDLCQKTPHAGRDSMSAPIFEHSRGAKVSVAVESVPALKKFFSSPPPGRMNHISYLSFIIRLFFFWGSTLRRVVSPARGRWAGKPVLGDYLPMAYFVCEKLVQMATDRYIFEQDEKDSRLDIDIDQRIQMLLDQFARTDPTVRSFLGSAQGRNDSYYNQRLIVCLVYRAFYGAWAHYGINGLSEPQTIFRQYLYGKRKKGLELLCKQLRHIKADAYNELVSEWIGLYLSPNLSKAARHYHLI